MGLHESEKGLSVQDKLAMANLEGDSLYSNTLTAVNIFVGERALLSMSEGEATWADFVSFGLQNRDQDRVDAMVTFLHRKYGINKIPARYAEEQHGEIGFSVENYGVTYEASKRNIASAIYGLSRGEEGTRGSLSLSEISGQVGEYLADPEHIALSLALFSEAARVLRTQGHGTILSSHRSKLDFRSQGIDSRLINPAEKHALKDSLIPILYDPMVEVGSRYGLSEGQVSVFLDNVMEPDVISDNPPLHEEQTVYEWDPNKGIVS